MKKNFRGYLNDYPNIQSMRAITKIQKDILSLLLFTDNNQNGTFTIRYQYISDFLEISRTTITVAIGLFEKLNFITVEKGNKGKNCKYTINYDALREYDNKLSEDATLGVKMKSSPKIENTDSQYEEISKQLTEIQLYIDSLNEKVNTLITILTEKQNLASKCLSTNV